MANKQSHSALQLWLVLASIPVMAVVAVYIYGALAFDDNEIIEIDTSLSGRETTNSPEAEGADLDREFTAPLDVSHNMTTTTDRPAMLPDLASTDKEQSLTQMLSKKNENLQLGTNGHPVLVRVQENDDLPKLAARYLGNAVFWPYVFMVNREKLPTVNAVKAGMTLYLPDSAYYDINLNDSLALQRAEALANSLSVLTE